MTEPDQQPDMPAALRLSVAIDELTQPGIHQLDRDHAAARDQLRNVNRIHVEHIRMLRARHTYATERGNIDGAERALCAMRTAGAIHRRHLRRLHAGLRPITAYLPSLLAQVDEAVHSTNGSGNGSRGAHRSPLNTTAVELLAAIRRTTRAADGQPTYNALTAWQPDDPEAAVEDARRWVMEARAIVSPARWSEAIRPCPACRNRHVIVTEDGQKIRKAAIQINLTDRYAACIHPSCEAWWPPERFTLLAAALSQDDVAS